MAFLPLPDEPNTLPLLTELIHEGKTVCVPHVIIRERRMFPVRMRDTANLRTGEYGILEPAVIEPCDPAEIDLMLIPGRAFDKDGNRLGRGGGYYDRFARMDAPGAIRCGIAFRCQLLDAVPHAGHDVPVASIITEMGVLRPPSPGATPNHLS